MANTVIQLKKSATPSAVPSNLANGELAINFADGKLFYKAANGSIVEFSTGTTGSNFGTVNANGTLIVSDTNGDVFTLETGENIAIVGDAINDKITIGLKKDVVIPSSGTFKVAAVGGDEGGEIKLGNAVTNSVLAGDITIDVYQDKLRFFESAGTNRGAFINLASAAAGVGTDILATGASATDTIARDQANTARNHANSAYNTANLAFDKANSTTYTSNVVISVADNSNAALRITQTGTAAAFLVEDATNPDNTPFIIDANGNMGFGTSNIDPTQWNSTDTKLFKISATAGFDYGAIQLTNIDGHGSLFLSSNAGDLDQSTYVWAANDTPIIVRGGKYLELRTGNDFYDQSKSIRMDDTGNVGIGRSNPGYKLDIVGAVNANSVLINGTPISITNINGAYDQANTARTHANTAHLTANAAYNQANTARTHANNAYNTANLAFDKANNALANTSNVTIYGDLRVTGTLNVGSSTVTINTNSLIAENVNVTSNLIVKNTDILITLNKAYDRANLGALEVNGTIIIDGTVGNKKLANVGQGTVKGRGNDQGTGEPQDLTFLEFTNALPIFSNTNRGVVPLTNGISYRFLRDDATWVTISDSIAFGQANTARDHANAAFLQANTARTHANTAHATANAAYDQANTARTHANTAHLTANAAYDQANTSRTHANNAYNTSNLAFDKANTAADIANTKLSLSGGTITGDLDIVGNLTISGNTITIEATRLSIDDPLIYLAANNYSSDLVDIGFIANYVNATGQNVHTGLYREHEDKMYYLFQGYDKEPINNHIGALSNNMTLAILNADLRTDNLWISGVNSTVWIRSTYDQANTARDHANTAHLTANASYDQANIARTHANTAHLTANAAYDQANTARNHANAAFAAANAASGSGATDAYNQANTARDHANTAHLTANAAFNQANTARTHANTAHLTANAAYDQANTARTHANTAHLTANAAYNQANTARDHANSAFNAANTVLVGNTISGSYTLRSTRKAINFIPGTNITINVDDDSAGDRANVTITSTASGGGGGNVAIIDESTYLTNTVSSIKFTGSGVTATASGNDVTVTITSGGGGGTTIETTVVSANTVSAVKDYRYILANSYYTQVTLPGSPSTGDTLYIIVANGLANNVLKRNSLKIMGIAEDMTIDVVNTAFGLVYADSNLGWRFI